MVDKATGIKPRISLNERNLSVLVYSLFSGWMLSFLFEGQMLYALTSSHDFDSDVMVFGGIAAIFIGTVVCGFFIKTKRSAKRLFLCAYPFFIAVSIPFFFAPSALWNIAVMAGSFFAGCCVAAWGIFLKSGTPRNERIKTVADVLILSNVLMILLNIAATYISPHAGLALSLLLLLGAFAFALKLPADDGAAEPGPPALQEKSGGIAGLLAFLCLFILIITIDSGLMYHVLNPAFVNIDWLMSWYWAVPYIAALLIMRNLPRSMNRAYILYVGIAMIGFSFIAFLVLDRSWGAYLAVDTLMLGACGIYDLFWWSILGEMLDYGRNPARILGIGLSANILGVLLGGLIGNGAMMIGGNGQSATLLALAVVCVTLIMLPPLNKKLTALFKYHAYLTTLSREPAGPACDAVVMEKLTEREREIASLLMTGKTYRRIADQLYVSENTVRTHVKKIYFKYGVKNRTELMNALISAQASSDTPQS